MSTGKVRLELGECYNFNELAEGSLVMWVGTEEDPRDVDNWIGIITEIAVTENGKYVFKKYIVWLDGDSYDCETWGNDPEAKSYVYLGRLKSNAQAYLNPPSE